MVAGAPANSVADCAAGIECNVGCCQLLLRGWRAPQAEMSNSIMGTRTPRVVIAPSSGCGWGVGPDRIQNGVGQIKHNRPNAGGEFDDGQVEGV